ncbi:hypothetical protein E2562_034989, partial [Oryza meyeriana var. granulata]
AIAQKLACHRDKGICHGFNLVRAAHQQHMWGMASALSPCETTTVASSDRRKEEGREERGGATRFDMRC